MPLYISSENLTKEKTAMIDVKGRWVLITGASRGIGKLIAQKMADSGSNLILQARKPEHLASISEYASSKGSKVVTIGCDLANPDEVKAMCESISDYDIDIIFNNAGIQVTYRPDVFSTVPEDYDLSFRVNTTAPMIICYAFLPKMLKKGFGRIINTTSGIDNEPEQGPYSASKAALDKVTKDLCKLINDEDIFICLTDPGWCRTDLGGPNAPNAPESATKGMTAPAFASRGKNGKVYHAQDYADMEFDDIVKGIEDGRFPL